MSTAEGDSHLTPKCRTVVIASSVPGWWTQPKSIPFTIGETNSGCNSKIKVMVRKRKLWRREGRETKERGSRFLASFLTKQINILNSSRVSWDYKNEQGWCFSYLLSNSNSNPNMWGTVPCVGNVAQPPLGKASGERGWQAGPTSMDRFSSGKSGLLCTLTAMRLALAKTHSPWIEATNIYYLHLPKVCAKPPKYGVWATSPLSCNILLFEVISSVLSFVVLKR